MLQKLAKDAASVKLDVKDKKILHELDFSARKSNASIAKKVGLGKQSVDYRIKRLEGAGIIMGYYPIINLMRAGYFYGRIFVKFHNITARRLKDIYSQIISDDNFIWAVICEGNYELILASWTKTLKGFKAICSSVVERFGRHIKDKKESVGVKLIHLENCYSLEIGGRSEISFEEGGLVKIDETDTRMLKSLCDDARGSLVSFSKKPGISAKAAAGRLKRMERDKLILAYRPKINHNLLGFTHYKIFFHLSDLAEDHAMLFRGHLKSLQEVTYIVEEIGICDIDVEIMLPSSQSLFNFIDEIRFKFPTLIRDYEILIIKKTLKIGYLPF